MRSFDEIKTMVESEQKLPTSASYEENIAYRELKFARLREKNKVITRQTAESMRNRARKWYEEMKTVRLRYVEDHKKWQDSLKSSGQAVAKLLKAVNPDADTEQLLYMAFEAIALLEGHNAKFYEPIINDKLKKKQKKIIRTPVGLMPAEIMEAFDEQQKDSA